jgi:PAS domain S-box-containing protein
MERVFSGLFLESPWPMLLVDVRSRQITRANAALERLLGFDAGSLPGSSLRQMDLADAADVEEHLLLALACKDDEPRRRVWRKADGGVMPVELRAARLHGDHGTVLALYVRDASLDQEGDDERSRAKAQLLLARKHEAMARMASGLAQDLEGILDGIERTVEGLRGESLAPQGASQGLADIQAAGARARRLIHEVLAFTGRRTSRPRTVGVNQVVKAEEEALREGLPPDVGLMARLCDDPAGVNVDPDQLREILVRLVGRARHAMPDGGYVVVTTESVEVDEEFARVHPPTRPGRHVVLGVTDTGEALDEETQSRIFEPYFVPGAEGKAGGLGLATVYGMVKQSGGTIWVTSRPGAGTTFRVYLPQVGG